MNQGILSNFAIGCLFLGIIFLMYICILYGELISKGGQIHVINIALDPLWKSALHMLYLLNVAKAMYLLFN